MICPFSNPALFREVYKKHCKKQTHNEWINCSLFNLQLFIPEFFDICREMIPGEPHQAIYSGSESPESLIFPVLYRPARATQVGRAVLMNKYNFDYELCLAVLGNTRNQPNCIIIPDDAKPKTTGATQQCETPVMINKLTI